ncbi:MAG: hypothetical protein EXQ58_07475 [Acidobacteria bacterium]|nr:hypothetical protein [Acidobacteriota bacterium]
MLETLQKRFLPLRSSTRTVQQSSGGLQEFNDLADGSIRFVIGGFEFALGPELGVGLVMKETMG